MPLGKYELASEWYETSLINNNGDKLKTFVQMLDTGLYYKQINLDSPQDVKLDTTDLVNTLFIIKKLYELVNINISHIYSIEEDLANLDVTSNNKVSTGSLQDRDNSTETASKMDIFVVDDKDLVESFVFDGTDWVKIGEYTKPAPFVAQFESEFVVSDGKQVTLNIVED